MLALDSKYLEYKPLKKDMRRKMSVAGYDIIRADIPQYFGEFFDSCFLIWQRWKTYGLPFAPLGSQEHPDYIIKIIDTFNTVEHLSRQKKQPTRGRK